MKKLFYSLMLCSFFVACSNEDDIVMQDDQSFSNEEVLTRSASMRRSLTPQEADMLKKAFPNLKTDNVTVTGEATYTYNCIAYSMGITSKWINPEELYNDFINQYKNAKSLYGASSNYEQTSTQGSGADVDGWGLNTYKMTHGSVIYSGNTWESKLGPNIRITHGRTELNGSEYGSILVSFVKQNSKISDLKEVAEEVSKEDIVLSDLEKNKVLERSKKVDSEIVSKFESLIAAWKNEINTNPKTMFSSSTLDYKQLPQFKSLQEMGSVIIPLIMEKLLDEENFFMLPLYDTLQLDSNLKIVYNKNDRKCLEGEQNRARRTARMWVNSL